MQLTGTADERVAVIDGHIHFWDPARFDYPWLQGEPQLRRRFTPLDLDTGGLDIEGFIFVQAACRPEQSAAEVDWVRKLAAAGTPVLGAVAHAPLEDGPAACKTDLTSYAADPLVVGVRRLLQDDPADFALRQPFIDAVRTLPEHGLTFDLCIRSHQLAEVLHVVESCPEVTFVLDHLGKPPVGAGNLGRWANDAARLADLPHVWCKLSGLASEADPADRTPRALLPYLKHALDVFGPDRCLFGSDWPVASTVIDYRGWYDLVFAACSGLLPAERDQVLSGNARKVYGLVIQERG